MVFVVVAAAAVAAVVVAAAADVVVVDAAAVVGVAEVAAVEFAVAAAVVAVAAAVVEFAAVVGAVAVVVYSVGALEVVVVVSRRTQPSSYHWCCHYPDRSCHPIRTLAHSVGLAVPHDPRAYRTFSTSAVNNITSPCISRPCPCHSCSLL